MRVVLLWARFGPYHAARARAAAELLCAHGGRLHACEVAAADHYAWAALAAETRAGLHTLCPGRRYAELTSTQIAELVRLHLDRVGPDCVAVNGWSVPEARAALAWCRARGRPAVVMSETKRDDGRRLWIKEWVKRRVLRGVAAGLVGGEAQRDYLASLGVPRYGIELGYNAIDNAHFAREAERARADAERVRAEHRLPQRYLFACTRLLPRKNIDGLLRAYARLRHELDCDCPDLVIAGSGAEEAKLRGLASALGLDAHVHWKGFVQYPELPLLYGLAEAFVHPALSEPWGLVINEAAASGLPLLVGDTVGAGLELVEHGVNGFRFDARNELEIAAALRRICELSPAARDALGAAARLRVADFGPQRFAQGLLKACAHAMKARAA